MNWSDSETEIYNKALANVEVTNKALARVYLKTQKEIADKLKQFFLSVDPSWSETYKIKRVEEIIKQQEKTLRYMEEYFIISLTAAYILNYTNTFKSYATILNPMVENDLEIITKEQIKKNLYATIGDYSFMIHEAEMRKVLQDELKRMVKSAIDRGINPVKLEKELLGKFGSNIARHAATARTEMLTAYSIAQEDSIRQAEEQGIKFRFKWLGRNDGRERESHIALNGTYAKLADDGNYYFYANGCKGTSPRLFTGAKSAGENINCRCRRLNIPQT